jgi:hypothetical protein
VAQGVCKRDTKKPAGPIPPGLNSRSPPDGASWTWCFPHHYAPLMQVCRSPQEPALPFVVVQSQPLKPIMMAGSACCTCPVCQARALRAWCYHCTVTSGVSPCPCLRLIFLIPVQIHVKDIGQLHALASRFRSRNILHQMCLSSFNNCWLWMLTAPGVVTGWVRTWPR